MKNLKAVSLVTQNILFILYIPLAIFSWLMGMASENAIGAANGLYSFLANLVAWLSVPVSLLFFLGMIQSLVLRGKGEYKRAMIWQFLPLAFFLMNCALSVLLETLPRTA